MNQDQLKLELNRDKVFLKNLYIGPNLLKNKTILNSAEDCELNTLIKYLHYLANGKIAITKENFKQLEQTKKLRLVRIRVEKMSKALALINGLRKDKILFLSKLSNSFPFLLYGLFNLQ